jgi:putative heme degradation protein
VGNHIVFVGTGNERAMEESLQLEQRAHASELEVSHPKLVAAHFELDTVHLEG